MRIQAIIILLLLLCVLIELNACTDDTEQPGTGTLSVLVIDESLDETVADVEITLSPINIVAITDENGLAVFEVPAGDYFVDANVCCIGPGFINYHLPVTLREGETQEVRLQACLLCL